MLFRSIDATSIATRCAIDSLCRFRILVLSSVVHANIGGPTRFSHASVRHGSLLAGHRPPAGADVWAVDVLVGERRSGGRRRFPGCVTRWKQSIAAKQQHGRCSLSIVLGDCSVATCGDTGSMNRRATWLVWRALGMSALLSTTAHAVEVRWDSHGIPHIYGPTIEETLRGFGYAQMQNHAEQVLLNVAAARGRYGEYFGGGVDEANVRNDIFVHTVGIPTLAEQWLRNGSATQRGYIEAFVNGANTYAQRHANEISPRKIGRAHV